MNDIKALCDQVRQTSYSMHRGMGGITALFSALFAFFAVK